jgi:hypothetical protein
LLGFFALRASGTQTLLAVFNLPTQDGIAINQNADKP